MSVRSAAANQFAVLSGRHSTAAGWGPPLLPGYSFPPSPTLPVCGERAPWARRAPGRYVAGLTGSLGVGRHLASVGLSGDRLSPWATGVPVGDAGR